MKNYQDMRVLRTKTMLKNAFIDLLEEKSYNKISIRELTEAAYVNRVTFYLHYKSIDDFVERLVDEIIEDLFEVMKAVNVDNSYTPETELITMTKLLEYIADHHRVYRIMLVTKGIPLFTPRLMELLQSMMLVTEHRTTAGLSSPEAEVSTWYLASALMGTISLWLEHNMPHEPAYMAMQFVKLNPLNK